MQALSHPSPVPDTEYKGNITKATDVYNTEKE